VAFVARAKTDKRYATKGLFYLVVGMLLFLLFLVQVSWMSDLEWIRWFVFWALIVCEVVVVALAVYYHRREYTDRILER
jgi:Ca2+/Na+ antiporter